MATVVDASEVKAAAGLDEPRRFLLSDISWEMYEALRENRSNWHIRMTYDDGSLELMSPSQEHSEVETYIGRMIETVAAVLGLPFKPLTDTTWKKPGAKKAKESDGCFYLANYPRVRHKKIDLNIDPPPDLAIEVEISRSALDALPIYAALGVPEVWRYDGSTIHVHVLQPDGSYLEVAQSLALPFLRIEEVMEWLGKAEELDNIIEWNELVRVWAREVLLPRVEPR